jgi:hypothetical protein
MATRAGRSTRVEPVELVVEVSAQPCHALTAQGMAQRRMHGGRSTALPGPPCLVNHRPLRLQWSHGLKVPVKQRQRSNARACSASRRNASNSLGAHLAVSRCQAGRPGRLKYPCYRCFMTPIAPKSMADEALLSTARGVVATTRDAEADLLLLLAEIDARKLYLRCSAYPSMFAFCRGDLGFSEDVAFSRIRVARMSRKIPAVIHALRCGRVHLAGLRLLKPVLTRDNHVAVLEEASGKSKRDIEVLVARLAPKPPVPDSLRKLPSRRQPMEAGTSELREEARCLASSSPCNDAPALEGQRAFLDVPAGTSLAAVSQATSPTTDSAADATHSPRQPDVLQDGAPATPPRAHRSLVEPLDGERFKVQFTATRALRDKIKEAQDLLAHSEPDGALAAILERALDLLIAEAKKKRFGVVKNPRAEPETAAGTSTTRHVPNAIKRVVYERDDGRCTFVDGASGRRCEETRRLEYDHIEGFARTHRHSVEAIRLRCQAHNQLAAEELYGVEYMEEARRRKRAAARDAGGPGTSSTRESLPAQPALL